MTGDPTQASSRPGKPHSSGRLSARSRERSSNSRRRGDGAWRTGTRYCRPIVKFSAPALSMSWFDPIRESTAPAIGDYWEACRGRNSAS